MIENYKSSGLEIFPTRTGRVIVSLNFGKAKEAERAIPSARSLPPVDGVVLVHPRVLEDVDVSALQKLWSMVCALHERNPRLCVCAVVLSAGDCCACLDLQTIIASAGPQIVRPAPSLWEAVSAIASSAAEIERSSSFSDLDFDEDEPRMFC